MKNPFKSIIEKHPEIITKGKTTDELIDEIHESFFTEVDKLLAEAKISLSLDTDKQSLIDKCQRLKGLGFTNTKEVIEAEKELSRLKVLKNENEKKSHIIDAINYFSVKYPQYKFITEESVLKICQKYGLIYGGIERFIGDVPEENLRRIEEFKINEEDGCYLEITRGFRFNDTYTTISHKLYIDGKNSKDRNDLSRLMNTQTNYSECGLEIAAPKSDFNMEGMEVKDFKLSKIEIPDPVVLKPVMFNEKKHYLIVTAWGKEARDIDVINEKSN